VQIYETGGRELGVVAREEGVELALVMIEAVLRYIVYGAYVDDCVALGEDFWVPSTDERGRGVSGEQAEHGDCEGLVSMEVTTKRRVSE
jgi:hypothetical protein